MAVSNIGIDDDLSAVDLLQLGRRFAKFDSNELATYTLPVTNFITDGGAKVLALDEEAAAPVLDLFRPEGFSREPSEGPAP